MNAPAKLAAGIAGDDLGLVARPIAVGAWVVIRYGRFASQLARVTFDRGGSIYARKWRRNSGRWTAERRLSVREILRPATPVEIARARREGAE